ncbi:MAG: STAS domain-containing protein [Microthrixaceae bacterium]
MSQTPASRLEIEETDRSDTMVLRGELDSHTAGSLDEALDRADEKSDLVLDLSAVDFVDSSGLRVLVAHHQRCDAGARLELAGPSGAVRRLLEMTGLAGTMNVTRGAGRRSLSAAAANRVRLGARIGAKAETIRPTRPTAATISPMSPFTQAAIARPTSITIRDIPTVIWFLRGTGTCSAPPPVGADCPLGPLWGSGRMSCRRFAGGGW